MNDGAKTRGDARARFSERLRGRVDKGRGIPNPVRRTPQPDVSGGISTASFPEKGRFAG